MIKPFRGPIVCLFLALAVACGPSQTVDWDIEVGLDNTIYPSLVVSTSSMQPDEDMLKDSTSLGDPWGLIGTRR